VARDLLRRVETATMHFMDGNGDFDGLLAQNRAVLSEALERGARNELSTAELSKIGRAASISQRAVENSPWPR
jgi:hypothetical protein